MEYDESYGYRFLFFFGQTENSSGSGSTTANMRLDMLNLDKTDTSINTDQKQSINLLNYKGNGADYHYEATSAVMAHPSAVYFDYSEIYGTIYHWYIVPMAFIIADNPT